MATKNDVTGDSIISRTATQQFLDQWDLIFGKKNAEEKDKEKDQKEVDAKDKNK